MGLTSSSLSHLGALGPLNLNMQRDRATWCKDAAPNLVARTHLVCMLAGQVWPTGGQGSTDLPAGSRAVHTAAKPLNTAEPAGRSRGWRSRPLPVTWPARSSHLVLLSLRPPGWGPPRLRSRQPAAASLLWFYLHSRKCWRKMTETSDPFWVKQMVESGFTFMFLRFLWV